ncbi:MAG: hypothetical protein C4570_04930 [Ammonifex sp.]|jgi:hypothetical protein|nr:MAG: hypothetical protein C4570_04930 [Ammonifex sp.]
MLRSLTAVSNSPEHKLVHKDLYAILKDMLQKTGRWNPLPAESINKKLLRADLPKNKSGGSEFNTY